MSSERLSLATLPSARAGAFTVPTLDPREVSIGIVHFGVGAFHRSHQAVFTEDAAAARGESGWGILGVTGRSDAVVRQLRPQDCLYGVLQKDGAASSLRIVGAIREVASPGADSARVVEVMASEHTHLATLTITEKGYLRSAAGTVDLELPGVRDDIHTVVAELHAEQPSTASKTAIGLLVRGLAARYRRGGRPFAVLSCDNIVHNGEVLKTVITSFADACDVEGFTRWLESSVSFPSSMVDRITPAVTATDHAEAFAMLGLEDEALVVAEPFSQWVIEDDFADSRPAWQLAGVTMTSDVMPFERAKLRVLNATHSLLAYLGQLSGYETIAQAVADEAIRERALRMLNDDILPTLDDLPGLNLAEYRDSVLDRFANPALAHTTLQVAMDGSQKLPNRTLATAEERLAEGAVPQGLALTIAAWLLFIASTMTDGGPSLDDPLAARLTAAVGAPGALESEPEAVVDRLFGIRDIFSEELASSGAFRDAVVSQLTRARRLTASRPSKG
ncbi:mannitol dehydrogenase family protein [Parafrigoribacterium soli]|uniref:mannitol dehydrogenase family protein n=1 Tax=Parafrigoribacterium soli TaxID=3144663 RepID=UPI0032EB182C